MRSMRALTGAFGISFTAAALIVAGCTVGPNYDTPPKMTMPERWTITSEGGITDGQSVEAAWWKSLNDPALDGLIEQAVVSNLDLREATARVREARALRGVVAADAYPQVNVGGGYTHSRESENRGFGFGAAGQDQDLYQAGFDASWEIDVFGRVRRSVEAADADIQAAQEDRRDVMVSLLAEVARNYVDLRGFQRRVEIAQKNVESQRQSVDLSEVRFKAGLTGELDTAQARAQLATTQSEIPLLEQQAAQSLHALALLLGREPDALSSELSAPGPIPNAPPQVPVGVPSDVLRRRPDVREAERTLAAATARIGVATADLFPRFSLTGDFGFSAEDFGKLFNAGSRQYSIGPSVTWPIFEAGRIKANIRVENARQEQAAIGYERAVLTSLADVEDALIAYWKEQVRRESLSEAVKSSQRAVDLSNELYSRGLTDFLNVLVNQRALFVAEDQLVQSDRAVTTNFIAVCKALGGGWDVFEPAPEDEQVASATK